MDGASIFALKRVFGFTFTLIDTRRRRIGAGAIKLAVEHRFRTYKAVFTIVGKRLPFRETTAFLDQIAPGVVAEFFAVDQFAGVAAVQLAAGSLRALA
ncbi:hypothetical protein V2J91_26835 [Pseudomonas alliivorans]|nr:hypothetical protein [Pseudomonas alliivorans]